VLTLPPDLFTLMLAFAPLFSRPVFQHVQLLVVGALLAPGRRTIAAILRALGRQCDPHFQNFHRVLNRDRWSARRVARVLCCLLVERFVPRGPVLVGIDDHLERRKGEKIAAKGIYRDAARSSKEYLTKVSALRWISLMLLVPLPWAKRVWALPCLTALAPSERYHQERGMAHKKLTDWARQLLTQLRRWLPDRPLIAVADSNYACLALLAACQRLRQPITLITRLRLDAALYEPAGPRPAGKRGRSRIKGKRLPTLATVLHDPHTRWRRVRVSHWYRQAEREVEIVSETGVWYHPGEPVVPIRWILVRDPEGKFRPQALLCTDLTAEPEQILGWFVQRWQLEVTFEEARAHLGIETQRQWNEQAIARTTPALFGLFSLVTLLADRQASRGTLWPRQAAWYHKTRPTFSDALAAVRRELWQHLVFYTSCAKRDSDKCRTAWLGCLTDALAYAA
jgi:DDE superfamily endonuclease